MKRNNKCKNQSRAFCEMRYKFNKARRMKALETIQENMNFVDCYDAKGNYLGVANEAISANGNGTIPDKDFITAYQTRKYEWLEEFNKHHGTTSEFCKEHSIKGFKRKRPWYVLLKRDSITIESSKRLKSLTIQNSWKAMFNTNCTNGSKSTHVQSKKMTCSIRSSIRSGNRRSKVQKKDLEI